MSPLNPVLLLVAAMVLGHALQHANGAYSPEAMTKVAIALGLTALAVANVPLKLAAPAWEWLGLLAVAGGLVFHVALTVTTAPGVYMRATHPDLLEHHQYVSAAAIASGAALAVTHKWARWLIALALTGSFLVLGFWMLRVSPSPTIDVWSWHNVAYATLKTGVNPYSVDMPNIYGHTLWYAPGLADNQRVLVGYPYPPLTFLLGGFGHLFAGDYRYANVVALAATAAMLCFMRPGSRIGPAAAAVLLFSPRHLFVLEQGWTEPLSIVCLAAVVFVSIHRPKLLPYALGLFFAVKQYAILVAPLTLYLFPRPWKPKELLKPYGIAIGLAAALNLPFFLWGPSAFFKSVVAFQGLQPFRAEALSFVAATAVNGVPVWPLWLSFPALIPGLLLSWFRAPRTPSAFAAGAAFSWMLFFAFAKQAFCNYYFFIVGALCVAAAAVLTSGSAAAPTESAGTPTSPS